MRRGTVKLVEVLIFVNLDILATSVVGGSFRVYFLNKKNKVSSLSFYDEGEIENLLLLRRLNLRRFQCINQQSP